MARFYSNENFPLPVVDALRKLGHDVLTTEDAGNSDRAIPDPEVLSFATAEDRAVLTFNRKHFIQLHKFGNSHAGIVVCTFDINFRELALRIDEEIKSADRLAGKLFRVNRPNTPQI